MDHCVRGFSGGEGVYRNGRGGRKKKSDAGKERVAAGIIPAEALDDAGGGARTQTMKS